MANTAPSAQSNPGRASLVTSPAQAMTGRKYCRTASHQIIMRRRIKSLKKRTMNNKRALQAQIVVPTSAIARLPSEIIQDILSFAQVACRSLPSPNFANDRDGKSDEQDEDSRPRMNMHQAQCWALSMTLVCKAWRMPALRNVWGSLLIRDVYCFDRVLETIDKRPSFADLVNTAIIWTGRFSVRTDPAASETDNDHESPKMTLYREQSDPVDMSIDDERHSAQKAAKFVKVAKNLQDITLDLCQKAYGHPTLVENAGVLFMNASLHLALCHSSLRALRLHCK
ncbi:hypothetical protein P389DRAFT_32415 [Cystobasidium minutum MCA 4210]|uniref:uncharacterized protein n=1 Tax=Cystobasidium minutum MCA 4210 TaxID=1397322 RepID=UPI0034CE7F6B|eukprot:jgi/Rhomi1/32415/CE32414_56